MTVTIKSIVLWRKEAENEPGVLAATLEPFASIRSPATYYKAKIGDSLCPRPHWSRNLTMNAWNR
jgi:hypothetical protein